MCSGPTWVPVGRLATDRSDSDPQLMTYRNFLDSFRYPYIDGVSEEVLSENIRRCRAPRLSTVLCQLRAKTPEKGTRGHELL